MDAHKWLDAMGDGMRFVIYFIHICRFAEDTLNRNGENKKPCAICLPLENDSKEDDAKTAYNQMPWVSVLVTVCACAYEWDEWMVCFAEDNTNKYMTLTIFTRYTILYPVIRYCCTYFVYQFFVTRWQMGQALTWQWHDLDYASIDLFCLFSFRKNDELFSLYHRCCFASATCFGFNTIHRQGEVRRYISADGNVMRCVWQKVTKTYFDGWDVVDFRLTYR